MAPSASNLIRRNLGQDHQSYILEAHCTLALRMRLLISSGRVTMSGTQLLPPFQLDDELRAELIGLQEKVFSKKGTLLFRRGDSPKGAFLLIRGEVSLSPGAPSGHLRRSCVPGCLLGLPATVRNRPYSLTAECLEDCEYVPIPRDVLLSVLGSNQAFCMHVVEILATEVGELRSRLQQEANKVVRLPRPPTQMARELCRPLRLQ